MTCDVCIWCVCMWVLIRKVLTHHNRKTHSSVVFFDAVWRLHVKISTYVCMRERERGEGREGERGERGERERGGREGEGGGGKGEGREGGIRTCNVRTYVCTYIISHV